VRVRDDGYDGLDEYWALREHGHDDVPVAELTDERRHPRPRRRGPRSRRWAAAVLVVALGAAGVALVARVSDDNGGLRHTDSGTHRKLVTTHDGDPRAEVLSALQATMGSGSFHIHSELNDSSGRGTPIVANGIVNVHPTVLVSTANVSTYGEITARIDGNRVWEAGGAYYGMSPGAMSGPGAPLSQFAGLVVGTLGPREGAVSMDGMASPTGYLDLAQEAITAASWIDDAVLDGVPVHEYEVTVDAAQMVQRPDLTTEERATALAALALLQQEGYLSTTVRLSIDDSGLIRHTHTTVHFAGGGTVDVDARLSDFGCSSIEMLPSGPEIVPDPTGCAAPSTTSVYSTTTSSDGAEVATTSVP
jgi:hypothetical protein